MSTWGPPPARPAGSCRAREPFRRLAPWSALLLAAGAFQAAGTPGRPEPGQGPPANESAAALAVRIDRLRSQGKVADAAQETKRWVDANRRRLPAPELVQAMRGLADLQTEAGQAGDAAETLREVVRMMRGDQKDFPDWTVRTVTAELSDVTRLAKLKPPDRKRLAVARVRVRAVAAQAPLRGEPTDELTEEDLAWARKTRALLGAEQEAVVGILGKETPSVLVADIREYLGLALLELRQWKRAEAEITAALRARTALYGAAHPQTAQTRAMLAVALSDPRRPDPRMDEALTQYAEIVATYERTLGPLADETLNELGHAAVRCAAIGRPDLALEYAFRLYQRVRHAFPDQPQRWAPAAELVGQSAMNSGNYPVAEETYRQLTDIPQSLRDKRAEAQDWLLLGKTRERAGDYLNAILALSGARDRFEQIPGAGLDVVSCLVPLAVCYRLSGQAADARATLAAADHILGPKPGRSIPALELYLERGRLLSDEKDWKGARSALQAALAAEPPFPVTVTAPSVAEVHRLLATAELGLGDPAGALKQLGLARDLCLKRLGPFNPTTLDTQYRLGFLQLQRGDKAGARANLAAAYEGLVKAADSLRLVAEPEAIRRLAEINTARDALLSVLRKEKDVPASELYAHVWRSKGLLTRHLMGRFARAAEDRSLEGDLKRLRTIKVELSNLLWRFPPTPVEEARRALAKLSGEKKLLESRLAFRPRPAGRPEAPPASLDDLAKVLPADVAVVDFVLTSQLEPTKDRDRVAREKIYYEAYVVRSRGGRLEVHRVELGTGRTLGPVLLRWREGVSRQQTYTKPVTRAEQLPPEPDFVESLAVMPDVVAYRGLGALLRQVVWDRIDPHLAGARTVVVLSDVNFDRVPWYALPGRKPDTDLIDDYAICTALNGDHLVALLRGLAGPPAPRPGGPHEGCLFVSNLRYGDGRWPPLLESGEEVPDIRGLPKAPRPRPWLRDDQAHPARVVEEMARRRYVHLSTHGKYATGPFAAAFAPALVLGRSYNPPYDPDWQFQDKLEFLAARRAGRPLPPPPAADAAAALVLEESPLSCGALVLSKSPGRGSPWDQAEVLSGEVIASLDLRGVDLVVLSACETNRGPALLGEGTLSLQRAFLLAEARSVVGSLWEIDDQATAELMRLFYINLWEKGLSKVEALRRAQRTMRDHYNDLGNRTHLEAEGAKPLSPENRTPPSLWAQFMLTGDWGPPKGR